ncbi:phage tail length tape measure family protein [Sphingobium bisphenolivorans]|uniref:phage tail length tape measure family protein n=1 Tax=Sphingobium bisphenolivorans TaxID=1335760 RepID=UPI00126A5D3A|nr:phage tail length tape measure family protein [Sphingobium bisphenolivorans]
MATDVKDLLLRIDASTELLRKNMAAAENVVGDFEKVVERELDKVEQRFSQLKGAGLSNSLRAIKEDFRKNFTDIQKMAAQAIEAPRLKGGGLDLGVGDAKAAAAAAQQQASALRLIADAAERAALGENELSRATDLQVRAARAAAAQAELQARQLTEQAGALERIQIEANLAAAATGQFQGAGRKAAASAGEQKAGYQQLSFQISDVATQFGMGAKPMQIFAAQAPQVVQAIGMIKGEASGLIGFLAGPWGAVMLGAVTVLGSLALADDNASKAKKGHSNATDDLRDAVDRLNNAERAASETTRQGIIDSINLSNARRQQAVDARKAAVAELELARSKLEADQKLRGALRSGDEMATTVLSKEDAALRAQYEGIRDRIDKLNGAILNSSKAMVTGYGQLTQRDVTARNDPRAAVEQRYEDAADAARRTFNRTGNRGAYDAALNRATQERDASLKVLETRNKSDRSERAAARRAARSDARYEDDKDNFAVAGLRAQADYSGEIDDRLKAELAALDAQLESYKRRLDLDENLSSAQRSELVAAQAAVIAQEKINAERKAADDRARERFELETAANRAMQDVLESQLDLAMGRKEELAIQRRILMLKQSQERAEQEAVLASQTATAAQKKIAQAALVQLDAKQAAEQASLNLRYASPLEQYQRSIAQTGANLDDAFENIGVSALDDLNNGLVDAIMNAGDLGEVFSNVARSIVGDLIKIAIQQTIVANLTRALGGLFGGGGAAASMPTSVPQYSLPSLPPGFASGGYTGNMPVNQVAGLVHGQEFVFDAEAVKRIGRGQLEAIRNGSFRAPRISAGTLQAASGGGAVRIEVASTEMWQAAVHQISGNAAVSIVEKSAPAVVAASVGQSRSDAVRAGRRRIPGRG